MFYDKTTRTARCSIAPVPGARRASLGELSVWLAALLIVLLPTVAWLAPEVTLGQRLLGLPSAAHALPPELALRAWAVLMAPVLVLEVAVLRVALFLRRVRHGGGLSHASAACIRQLGLALVASLALVPAARLIVAHSLDEAARAGLASGAMLPGTLVLSLGAAGVCLLALARELARAAEIAEDNARIV